VASGQQIGEQNVQTFLRWMAGKTDGDYRAMAMRGALSRKEIVKECGFAKSAFEQNPRIKAAPRELEDGLRQRGILPRVAAKGTEKPQEPRLRDGGAQKALLACYRLFTAGHAIASACSLAQLLKPILGSAGRYHHLINRALERGQNSGSYIANQKWVQPRVGLGCHLRLSTKCRGGI
jgi:hypothetical protein